MNPRWRMVSPPSSFVVTWPQGQIGRRCRISSSTKTSPSPTYHELFPRSLPAGPPPAGPFTVDVDRLRQEYLQLQRRAHPDRHPPETRSQAEGTSMLINEAYQVLRHPLRRAQYLLSLRGVDVVDDETATVDNAQLLTQVMDVRELIDDATDEAALRPIREANDARLQRTIDRLGRAFTEDDLLQAKEETVKLRYWLNVEESLQNWEPAKPSHLQQQH